MIFLNLFLWVEVYKTTHRVLTIAFLDVGQGDAIFIETPNGNQILIDGGGTSSVLRELGVVMPFYDRSIDVVLATHPDADHIGGLPSVLERFKVDAYINPNASSDTSIFLALETAVKAEEANSVVARTGQRIRLDTGVYFDVYLPDETTAKGETNEASVVGKLVYKDFEVMLTGDVPAWVENSLATNYGGMLEADILKVSHHGSKTSSSELFLTKVNPKLAVISSGLNNRYGHPHEIVLDRFEKLGIEIKNTATSGRIIIRSDGSDY